MTPFLTLLSSSPYIETPSGLVGWLGFILFICMIGFLTWNWRELNESWGNRQWVLFVLLLLSVPITSLFIGIRLPVGAALPPPGIPRDPAAIAVMIFAAVPWAIAAGTLGPTAAAALAVLSGLLIALWETHSPFTPLEYALLATLFGAAVRQRYRTPTFRFLRHPLAIAILLSLFFPFVHMAISPFTIQGALATLLDYTVTNMLGISLAVGIELFIAGLISEVISLLVPNSWGGKSPLIPSPAEKSLQTRFITSMAPLAIVLILTLMAGDWYFAGKAAREMLEARMQNAAALAAENVPYFLETGQNLIENLVEDERLLLRDEIALVEVLSSDIRTVPFFHQLTVTDEEGKPIASYPTSDFIGNQAPIEEQSGILHQLQSGLPFQIYTVPPTSEQSTAQVSFVATIFDDSGQAQGVLIGRGDLGSNPMTKPLLSSLNNLTGIDGQGILLDENGRILVHSDPERVMTTYSGQMTETSDFFDDTASDGTRALVYFQPAKGRPWSIVLTVPALRAQQMALDIAFPVLAMIVVLSLVSIVVLRLGVRAVTSSLQNLASEADRIAQGQLDRPLSVDGEDEVGQLRRAFEKMRFSLKSRLDELNQLLLVSQGVASSLEISDAVQPVLEAALGTSASSARVVLTPSVVPEIDGASYIPVSYGRGPSQEKYSYLDEQVLALTRQQDRIVLPNTSRPRLLNFTPGAIKPESLLAVALRHENLYFGCLWVAYDEAHTFLEEEVRFLVTLGGQAALAASNAQLYLNAEIGRQRLDSILASSPDPMLVIDQGDRLILANPAAWQVLNLGADIGEGRSIQQVITLPELVDFVRSSDTDEGSKEILLPDGRVFLATATSVLAEGQRVGRVCVMRDVTHFKQLDDLKSEFVSTVSHDLRSPLTLMRGYATMLEMVGQLNEQQLSYIRKIVSGAESMSRLVNNLLDLGRIEAGIGLQLELIPINEVVDPVVGALQLQAAQKRIKLTSEIPQKPTPSIEVDPALLQQALQNLVENAIKYTKPEGKVHLRVRSQPVGTIFEVSDTGIGISPMDQPRLFEKFYRGAHQVSRDQRGTGLGLAIVKSIAERHGGRVWAESQLGKGSTFYLAIPVKQPKSEREAIKSME